METPKDTAANTPEASIVIDESALNDASADDDVVMTSLSPSAS
jgi:hypothetical protein